jgi:hypothetical protein
MKYTVVFLLGLFLTGFHPINAQQLVFSEPEKDDARNLNFEILGKIGGNILIYKNTRDLHQMSVYDMDMKMVGKLKMDYLNEKGRVLSTDFIQYSDYVLLLYQFQNKNIVYAMAVKIDGNGKKIGDPLVLDTTSNINFNADNKIYTFINSEDKQKIAAFKISTKNEKEHAVISCLFDKSLSLLEKVRVPISMPEKNDFLGEFGLANNGNLVCLRQSGTGQNDNINKVSLLVKPMGAINFKLSNLPISKLYLDDTRVKIDNRNGHCIITSFFSKIRRGNIDGLYYTLWDINGDKELLNATTTFSEEYRSDVRADGQLKMAFNDFYLKNLVLRKDGGFMIIAESAYVSNRGSTLNRWDYMNGNPFYNPFGGGFYGNSFNYFQMNGANSLYYPWGGVNNMGMMNNMGNNVNRYYADNVAIISFEPDGKMEWSNVIRKTQYDDNTDNYIGYGIVNSGDQIHFLFNLQEKRSNILTDQSMSPSGQIDRNPTIKNLDKGYDFMPRHIKQIGLRQAVLPCMYRGYTCFAKVDF